ncbi:VOC family protein [uncultured Litoreibacter sp.]|uniref:VOC family protein n=1 Tax=uncultured Litoreibacter sp. TaxID=1392394 RepID=UPI002634D172|nr:VOC family protein [uncultured Litoreibacter sp.]
MIDHMNLPVTNVHDARGFYDAVLATLGVAMVAEDGDAVGYGAQQEWSFGLVPATGAIEPLHVGFSAASVAEVDAFHAAALAAGGTCNGAPGDRPQYGAGYYAAYILDPDGHNIEAVIRR